MKQQGQRRQRRQQRQQNHITEPLTPRELRKETRVSTNLKFHPLERNAHKELKASNKRVGQVGQWWNNYLATVAGTQAATQQAYQQAGQEAQGFINQASGVDNANTAALQQEAAQSAALRGAPASTEAAGREQAAQAQRNYLGAAYGAKTALQGANQFAYLGDQRRIGAGQKIASMREEQARGRGVKSDIKDLKGERGEYASNKRQELRKEERDYKIQRAATGLNNRQQNQAEREGAQENRRKNASTRRERAANRRENEAQRNENREQRNQDKAARTAGKGGTAGLTPSERQGIREGRQNAVKEAWALYKSEAPPRGPKEWAKFQSHLASQSEISPSDAAYAVQRLKQKVARQAERPGANLGTAQGGVHR